ncbi:GerMN domain-containing protein [Paenibacillus crassostreae]|uniref:GerMN domain-containing protein n=1 Tax=Paenibacillus crassostreae TaxID=1763538 RepID=A0A162KVF9_9BACL|nr:GerMN domain-containing protein [Paenibacillus crassostreae]AOZ91277.1 hypothetical protein LPB68_03050 [Paenibacillus crassostreae]OAB74563.1 hypothetical protein PNBC_10910 [Paenibacillus crassostreae]
MIKKMGCILILSLLMIVGLGCGEKPLSEAETLQDPIANEAEGSSTTNGTTSTVNANNGIVVEVEDEGTPSKEGVPGVEDSISSEIIKVYYTDMQAMELIETTEEINFSNDEEKYIAAFKALQSSKSSEFIPLWEKIELKTLKFNNGDMVIDIHMPDEARLGSGGEQFALTALTSTLFQFEEVNSIDLLVDGQSVESLMGHVDLLHPMLREDVLQ